MALRSSVFFAVIFLSKNSNFVEKILKYAIIYALTWRKASANAIRDNPGGSSDIELNIELGIVQKLRILRQKNG